MTQRFERGEVIGRGRLSLVRIAWDYELETTVALKEFSVEPGRLSGLAIDRFKREADLGSRLDHPALVKVLDFINDDNGVPTIVMEYVGGTDLEMRATGGGVSWRFLHRWVEQVSDALTYLHSEDIIHRDVKPANIFIGRSGDAQLGDLGIALEPNLPRLTSTGLIPGTTEFLAPEVALLHRDASAASDIWSLGATILACVESPSGTPFFFSADLPQLRERLRHRPLTVENEVERLCQSGVPERLAELVGRMVSDDPACRPSAAEVLAEFEFTSRNQRQGVAAARARRTGADLVCEAMFQAYIANGLLKRVGEGLIRPWVSWTPSDEKRLTDSRLTADGLYEFWNSERLPFLVCGDSGTGKSTAALMMIEKMLDLRLTQEEEFVPLYVSLAGWDPRGMAFRQWVCEQLSLRLRLDEEVVSGVLENEPFVLFVDQVDDLAPQVVRELVISLNELTRRGERALPAVIVAQTSTIKRSDQILSSVFQNGLRRVTIHRLGAADIEGHLRARRLIPAGSSLDEQQIARLREHVDTPLRLNAALEVLTDSSIEIISTDLDSIDFWSRIFSVRLGRIARSSPYNETDLRRWLTWISVCVRGNAVFWLAKARLPLHLRVAIFGSGVITGVIAALYFWFREGFGWAPESLVAVALVAVPPIMCGHSLSDGRLRYVGLPPRYVSKGVGRGLLVGGCAIGVGFFAMPALAAILFGVIYGAIFGLRGSSAVQYGDYRDSRGGTTGVELVRNSLASGFVFGPLYGIAIGLPLAYLTGSLSWFVWCATWLILGGQGGAVHHLMWCARSRLLHNSPPVKELVKFLDWCVDRELLRSEGGNPGYSFAHPQHWEYFRALSR